MWVGPFGFGRLGVGDSRLCVLHEHICGAGLAMFDGFFGVRDRLGEVILRAGDPGRRQRSNRQSGEKGKHFAAHCKTFLLYIQLIDKLLVHLCQVVEIAMKLWVSHP
jgi:hypothetical protein